jgi:hypothetical protein
VEYPENSRGGVPGEAQSGNQPVAYSPDIDDFYGDILAKMFSEPGDKYIHGSLVEEIIIPPHFDQRLTPVQNLVFQ